MIGGYGAPYGGRWIGGSLNPLNWVDWVLTDDSTYAPEIPEAQPSAPAAPGQPAPQPEYTSPVRVEEIAPEALPTPSGATPIAQQKTFPTWAKIALGVGAFLLVVGGGLGVGTLTKTKRRRRRRRRR